MRTSPGIICAILCLAAAPSYGQEPPPQFKSIKQVQIHVWISETNEEGLREVSANLTFKRFVRGEERSGSLQQINTQLFDPLSPLNTVTLPAPDPTMFNPPLRPDQTGNLNDGVQTQVGAGLTFNIVNTDRGSVEGIFRSLETQSDIDLISKPELLVVDGLTAEIHAGGRFPFQGLDFHAQTGVPNLHVQWRNIGVNMKITPKIRPDNIIELNIDTLEVSDIARIENIRGIDLPVFSKRSQTGLVLVPNGQALVIGGLSSRVTIRSERRVPFLGSIPILGIPFRSRKSETSNTHLLIFVSPTVVDLRDLTPTAANALDFWRERGWRNTDEIENEIKAMKDEL